MGVFTWGCEERAWASEGGEGRRRLSPTCQLQCDRAGLYAMAVVSSASEGPHVPAAHPADPKTVLVIIWLAQLIHTRPGL